MSETLVGSTVAAEESLWSFVSRGLKHNLFGQAREMMVLQVVTKLLSVAASAWAVRCLGPEKLGISGMIMAICGQVGLLAGMNMDILLTRRFKDYSDPEAQQHLIDVVQTLRIFLCLLALGLGLPLFLWIMPSEWRLGILAAAPIFLFSLNQPYWILSGRENLAANSRSAALISLVMSVSYVLFFRPGQRTGSDLVVTSVATGLGWGLSWFFALRGLRSPRFRWNYLKEAWPLIKEVRWLFLTAVVCYVYTSLDGSLLGYLHSLHELGLARPAGQLVSSLNQFFALVPLLLYPRLIQWNKVGADFLWERQKKLGWILALGSVPIALGAFVLAPFVFPLLYGREFAASAYPFVILLTSKLVVLVNGIFGWGLWAKGEDIVLLKIMSVVAIVSLSLNLVLIPKWGLLGSTFVNLASESLILVLTFHACRRLARITPVTL